MHVEEQIAVPAGQDQVWDFVWQTERLAACLPGCTEVETVTPGQAYRAVVQDRIGPYRIEADLDITVEEVEPPDRIRLRALGKDRRLGATQRVALEIRLRPVSPHETSLDATGEVEVLGKIASLGQFAIKRKLNDILKQFGANLSAACAATEMPRA
jgi:carbon monoxide dehydrogenase subunit G